MMHLLSGKPLNNLMKSDVSREGLRRSLLKMSTAKLRSALTHRRNPHNDHEVWKVRNGMIYNILRERRDGRNTSATR